jgi:hypothetical protein
MDDPGCGKDATRRSSVPVLFGSLCRTAFSWCLPAFVLVLVLVRAGPDSLWAAQPQLAFLSDGLLADQYRTPDLPQLANPSRAKAPLGLGEPPAAVTALLVLSLLAGAAIGAASFSFRIGRGSLRPFQARAPPR